MEKSRGIYMGTEIDGKWWKRYKKDKLFARGNGEYWFDDTGLYFHRYLTKAPIFIPFSGMTEAGSGKWHSGHWGMGIPIIKIFWEKDGQKLCSGFMLSKRRDETEIMIDKLTKIIAGRVS